MGKLLCIVLVWFWLIPCLFILHMGRGVYGRSVCDLVIACRNWRKKICSRIFWLLVEAYYVFVLNILGDYVNVLYLLVSGAPVYSLFSLLCAVSTGGIACLSHICVS